MKKDQKIKDYQDCITQTGISIAQLTPLISALKEYDKKIIDKRFFEKYFKQSNEFRTWTEYKLSSPRYPFLSKHSYEIYINSHEYLKLDNRERDHILSRALTLLAALEERLRYYHDAVKSVSAFNEQALIDDLKQLYIKHGKPSLWREVVESLIF